MEELKDCTFKPQTVDREHSKMDDSYTNITVKEQVKGAREMVERYSKAHQEREQKKNFWDH